MPPLPYAREETEPQPRIRIVERVGIDPIILLREAAALASCHPDTLKNQARKGNLKLIKVSERRIGVRQSEFDRFLNSRIWATA
jgi:hypothetical protein